MLVISSIFFILLLNIFDQISCLIELPTSPTPDNDLFKTEIILRNVTKNLFSLFMLDPAVRTKESNFTLIYNYLASLSKRDYNTLNDIAELTKVDKNINQTVIDFITVINEILNETHVTDSKNVTNNYNVTKKDATFNDDFEKQFKIFVSELKSLNKTGVKRFNKEKHKDVHNLGLNFTSSPWDLALGDLNMTINSEGALTDSDSDENNTIVNDNDNFWVPSGRRIYKGKRTKIKTYPFMASVHIFRQFTCAGSIIKSDLVITAASCLQLAYNNRFFRENPKFLSVNIGSTFYTGGGEEIDVLEVFFHPGYVPQTLKHNLAVMRLHRNIQFSKKRKKVKMIKIDRSENILPHNIPGITVIGWGARDARNNLKWPWAQALSYAVLDVYHIEDCMDVYSKTYVTRNHFCAGFISRGGGACNRDVGGPGIVDGILMGIISFGPPTCGKLDSPTVFTKLGHYSEWICSIMEQEDVAVEYARTTTTLPTSRHTIGTTTPDKMLEPIQRNFVTEIGESLVTKVGEAEITKEAARVNTEAAEVTKAVAEVTKEVAEVTEDGTNVLREQIEGNYLDDVQEPRSSKAKKRKKEAITEHELFKNFVKSIFGKEGNDYIEELSKDKDLRNNEMYKEFVETVFQIKHKGINEFINENNAKTKENVVIITTTPEKVFMDQEKFDSDDERNLRQKTEEKSSNERTTSKQKPYTEAIYDEIAIRSGQSSVEKKVSMEKKRLSEEEVNSLEEKKESSEKPEKKINENVEVRIGEDEVTHGTAKKEQTSDKNSDKELILELNQHGYKDKELDDAIRTLMYIAENAKKEGLIEETDVNAEKLIDNDDDVLFRTDHQTQFVDQEPLELNLSREIYDILAETLSLSK